jgi:citrate synthase
MAKYASTTKIAIAETDRVVVRGTDLCAELIGHVSFSEFFIFLLTGHKPDAKLVKVVDATMISIAEHGLVPSVQAARMTWAAAPESMQGAVAAGLLGCGSVILGAAESAGRLLLKVIETAKGGDLVDAALEVVRAMRAEKQPIPGFGHDLHKPNDPRAIRLLEFARELGVDGPHIAALDAVRRAIPTVYNRELVLNVSGAIPAVLLDAGFPAGAMKGIPLIGRTASLIGHLLEENVQPIGFTLSDAAAHAITYEGALPARPRSA